jgi:molecular chaperone HscB
MREPIRSMIDFSHNHFQLFGLPERFRFDAATLDNAYRALQGEVHPDRFAAASEAEQRLALQSSARVNEAYQALRDPVRRAQYLLSLRGIDAFSERDTTLGHDFLERQLERREAAGEALAALDASRLATLAAEVRADAERVEQRLAARLDSAAWDAARADVRELRFLAKLAADIDAMQAELEF